MPSVIRCVDLEPFHRQKCLNEKYTGIAGSVRLKGCVRFKSEVASGLVSFPGLPIVQSLIAYSIQKQGVRNY